MRIFLAAAIAVAALAPLPALADEIPFFAAPGPDSYPPLEPMLHPSIEAQVAARDGRGLSLAGFYNDPTVLMRRAHAPPVEHGFFSGWFGH